MKPENKITLSGKEKLYVFFYAVLALCSVIFLFRPKCNHDAAEFYFTKEQTQQLVQKVNTQKQQYENQIASLEKSNSVLKLLLHDTDKELESADAKTNFLKQKIYLLIDTENVDSISEQATACVSYIVAAEHRDSICDRERVLLSEMIENRDSAFLSCDNTLKEIDSSFQFIAERHSQLADQLLFTQNNLKKANRRAKIWSGAAILLSGISVTLWLQNH